MVCCGRGDPRDVGSTSRFPDPTPADEDPAGLFGEINNDCAELKTAEDPRTFLSVLVALLLSAVITGTDPSELNTDDLKVRLPPFVVF
jgi:hypothetical protein